MKKLLLLCMMLAIGNASFSQFIARNSAYTVEDYLLKSRNQKTGAWILLGGGAALTLVGIVAFDRNFNVMSNDESGLGEAILTGVGIAAMGGSIPLFASAAKNKKRAAQVHAGLKMDSYFKPNEGFAGYPALSLKIGLK